MGDTPSPSPQPELKKLYTPTYSRRGRFDLLPVDGAAPRANADVPVDEPVARGATNAPATTEVDADAPAVVTFRVASVINAVGILNWMHAMRLSIPCVLVGWASADRKRKFACV